MPTTDSPLRYPGGKTQLTPFVLDLARTNGLLRGVYAEPFAGGAGIAWRLLLNGDMNEVWLNDVDPAIHAFWHSVVNEPDPLCERILNTEITLAEWTRQRTVLQDTGADMQSLAFATLFLNRTNRSGILKGGVIGGKNQDGNYKLDCRFNRDELIHKIQRIHGYREVIQLSRLDAEECLKAWSTRLPKRSLLNIDPPYFAQGRDLYLSYYETDDHARLAKLVKGLQCHWMLTYDDTPEIEELYTGLPMYRKGLTYYAQVKRKASELLVLSPRLTVPTGLTTNPIAPIPETQGSASSMAIAG
ncbi:DNA adenine methylase [Zoogloea sp.]|uniref:DNA adenine methylase n=1 Tax=Zoogloea sp. TaxID=49181 RepID=UPI0035B0366F